MTIRRRLGRGVLALLFGWMHLFGEVVGPLGGWMGWRALGEALVSTVFWSTLIGVALCEFTDTHAWLSGVVGL